MIEKTRNYRGRLYYVSESIRYLVYNKLVILFITSPTLVATSLLRPWLASEVHRMTGFVSKNNNTFFSG